MYKSFIAHHLPTLGKDDEIVREIVGIISRDDLLNSLLAWISHSEYVSVVVEQVGENFNLTSYYHPIDYDAVARINGTSIEYVKPWGEARNPQPPVYGIKMTLPGYGNRVEILLTEQQKDDPSTYSSISWGRGGTLYDGAIFENIPGGEVTWKEGETQKEFHERAHKEFLARVS